MESEGIQNIQKPLEIEPFSDPVLPKKYTPELEPSELQPIEIPLTTENTGFFM